MLHKFAVALFESKGIAEDAANRLQYEGFPRTHITLLLLREMTVGIPAAVSPEVEGLTVDPLVIGDVRQTFAEALRNGETALFVRAETEEDVDAAVDTIRQYAPMRIRVITADEGAPIGRDLP